MRRRSFSRLTLPLTPHCDLSTDLPFIGRAVTLPAKGAVMDAAGARKRVKRLTTLIDGLTKEKETMQAGLGVLTREEWTPWPVTFSRVAATPCWMRPTAPAPRGIIASACQS